MEYLEKSYMLVFLEQKYTKKKNTKKVKFYNTWSIFKP